jgi:hypothetical protein
LYDHNVDHTPAKRRRLANQHESESPAHFSSATALYTYQTPEKAAFTNAQIQVVSTYQAGQQSIVCGPSSYDTTSDTRQYDRLWSNLNLAPSVPMGGCEYPAFPLRQHSISISDQSNLIAARTEFAYTCGHYDPPASSAVQYSATTVPANITEAEPEPVCFGMASGLIVVGSSHTLTIP